MIELDMLVGESIIAMCHPNYSDSVGVMSLDVVTDGGLVYRFTTEEIDGERTAGGWTQEHYSLTVERLPTAPPQDERTELAGTIVSADLIWADEWLGPIDRSIETYGENPRMLSDGRMGSCLPAAKCARVVRGVVLQSQDWKMLVSTHAFPQHLDFTTDPAAIDEFMDKYRPGSGPAE
jgi:hypothetical protein